ncbi:hypothetical protein H072_4650 [Dactylellina haptotyla CBS 200.50]|uniref:Uncharacterized protein n=1 Tax=Dactylellina haptotyla (strain CBS 200.50) TaxID=1284197 RepID=S8AK09_DACHA|nr:hypothetical protein H072_4650 [Dactylellina haptotyla CBS 200.50]
MATIKNRGTYRVNSLAANLTVVYVENLLTKKLTVQEIQDGYKVSKISLAPVPTSQGRQAAIFRFHPGAPEFLSGLSSKDKIHIADDMNSNGQKIEIDADFWGLTQLYKPKGHISIDIVALSGLNAHAFGSWVGQIDDSPGPMWLQDFLAEEPDLGQRCRVMVFGYNAKTKSQASHSTLGYATSLLEELDKARSRPEEKLRPLVLLGHSYGGHVIAQAFTTAAHTNKYKDIYHSIVRIVNFGVPHRGIDLEDVKTSIEGKDSYARTGDPTEVVSRNSAVLGLPDELEEEHAKDGDHSDLVKFTSPTDSAYTTITTLLSRILQSGDSEVEARTRADIQQEQRQLNVPEIQIFEKLNPETAIYIKSQLLRVAVDANLDIRVEWLLRKGADPNYLRDTLSASDIHMNTSWLFKLPSHPETTAKHTAGQRDVARVLESDDTALTLAVKRGNIRTVTLLLQNGAAPNLRCSDFTDDRTPLHEACRRGYSDIVQCLLDNGANPNATTGSFATTPLHEVVEGGHYLVDLLVCYGADINAKKCFSGDTPLHIAAKQGKFQVVHTLIKKAHLAAKNKKGSTPLHVAAEGGHLSVVKVLLRENESDNIINIQNNKGRTALHEAAEIGNVGITQFLLDKGANRSIQTEDGETALDVAIKNGQNKVANMLT